MQIICFSVLFLEFTNNNDSDKDNNATKWGERKNGINYS